MNRKVLLAIALVGLSGLHVLAQNSSDFPRKWDSTVEMLIKKQTNTKIKAVGSSMESRHGVIITCHDTESVLKLIKNAGFHATHINDNIITASLPLNFIQEISKFEGVKYIHGAKKVKPTMHTVRKNVNVDAVHKGTDLETPFTGKGVVVGVIDQGFEYQHISFLDKDNKSRVKVVWNHYGGGQPTTNIPADGDRIKNTGGHASHVTNIAAGSKVDKNRFYGLAHEADIIMIPSTFQEGHILEEAKYISDYAKTNNQPFVINMSFGSQLGPHDGTTVYCRAMDNISQEGGILVAAMGNEADLMIHAKHTFTQPNEKVHLIIKKGNQYSDSHNNMSLLEIWEQTGDGMHHITAKPFILQNNGIKDYKNSYFWSTHVIDEGENGIIDEDNSKQFFPYYFINDYPINGYYGIEITGNPGNSFHAWIEANTGEFTDATPLSIPGDNEYCVGESAATISSAVSVAAYNGNRNKWGEKNDIAFFSSRGPFLGNDLKPTIAAPGVNITSAISKYSDGWKDATISVDNNGQKYYFDSMSGTSMASPVVTGIIALWLEANPQLTPEQVKYILKETSIKDNYTGNEWNPVFGHGKIDAYAGLKKALELIEQSGINDMLNSETPFTILSRNGEIRVLFNNDESFATLTIYTPNGMEVKRTQLNDIRRGNETVINTNGLQPGVYLVRLNSTSNSTTKKILVK